MEHADALERIEIAAVEPDGLERLMAGDTPDAAAVAGHLAGCPMCTAELSRIRRSSGIARDAIRSLPDPALRDRTLAYVRAVGRDRSEVVVEVVAMPPVPASSTVGGTNRVVSGNRRRYAVISGLAAAVVIAGVLGFATAGVVLAPGTDSHDSEVAVLSTVTETTMRIEQGPDATHLVLTAPDGGTAAAGTLLFSPGGGELVMVADGLAPAPEGMEYGCWIEVNGERHRIGRMYPGGGMQAWAGPMTGLAELPAGTVFGISLVPVGGGAGEPMLTGKL